MEKRPWGTYEVLAEDGSYKVKRIIVKPNHRLSYQTHEQRVECWTIVQGHGVIPLEDKEQPIKVGDAVYIDKGDN